MAFSLSSITSYFSKPSAENEPSKQLDLNASIPAAKDKKLERQHPYQHLVEERKELLAAVQPSVDDINRAHSVVYIPTHLPSLSTLIQHPGQSPYPVWGISAAFAAGLFARVRYVRGWPHPFILSTGSVVSFLMGSLLMSDPVIGSSTIASWSLVWTFFFSKRTNRSYQIGPRLLNYAVLANGALYGYQFIEFMRM